MTEMDWLREVKKSKDLSVFADWLEDTGQFKRAKTVLLVVAHGYWPRYRENGIYRLHINGHSHEIAGKAAWYSTHVSRPDPCGRQCYLCQEIYNALEGDLKSEFYPYDTWKTYEDIPEALFALLNALEQINANHPHR